ncbi:SDR family oxidoreductase [Egibacter rhizosphaerae]|uniref:SDR family oxidoreductase n=1 Tax=Egibacter rhizosphaerae TaxID=1670831 RepID=A0A411YLL5_9ACTN|nr:SDR family oxidoreductase [Egibacter rhizosphaerae]QBI22098.1 SDR family oxidoreductase [Egibacter rhizosphaerae]
MFEGRTALVTGGSRGIGYAIAGELVSNGARVCVTGRKQAQLDEALAELGGGDGVIGVAGGSDDPQHREDAVARTVEAFGAVDLLVNNAGTNPQYGPLVDADLKAVDKIMSVNVVAPLGWVQEAWRAWMAEHGGVVLNVASIGGLRPGSWIGAYNTSKAGLIQLTRQLALELGPTVRVNAIAPAVVKTDFASALYEGREGEVAAKYPMKRLGTPSDAASAARWLLSDEAGWVTGETVVLDGGVGLVGWDGPDA